MSFVWLCIFTLGTNQAFLTALAEGTRLNGEELEVNKPVPLRVDSTISLVLRPERSVVLVWDDPITESEMDSSQASKDRLETVSSSE